MTSFIVAVITLGGFIINESRQHEPLLDLRFFRSIPFSGASVTAITAFAGFAGFLFLNTIYLQQSRGLSPLAAGLDTLPMAVMIVVMAPISGAIVGRHGARWPLVIAGLTFTVSALMLTELSNTTSFAWLFVAYVVYGIGFGVVNAPITNAAVSGMPNAQAGVAAAVTSTGRQIGQVVGVAIVGTLATVSLHGTTKTSFATASHAGWWMIAGCGVVVFILGFVTTSSMAKASAQRVAASFEESTIR